MTRHNMQNITFFKILINSCFIFTLRTLIILFDLTAK